MANINVKTKNQSGIEQKPRVYFTCHPDDFDRYFRKLCDDIFATHDCAIYYTEDMSEVIDPKDMETDLGRNNLFVVPVTLKLLITPNRAMDIDIPYALQEHIPVLPFMMETGLDALYSLPNKFGELQYLSPYSSDPTEISYDEKLKKHLESVLISDELAKRVRAAFDAYIFLSYRKKDRRYANELMRLIHSIPQCRDIAIWFDEFLTPGESFRESIDKILHDSKLFALLVTPSLLEEPDGKPNFVMAEEYPAARDSGIPILPTEMEDTDRDALQEKFPNIPDCVKTSDEAFRNRLLDTITKLATEENNTPEHNYLIGLAYLDGIDVEVNRQRALELITVAAEADLPEAMEKLYRMYDEGIGVALDYRKAVVWAQKLADYMVAHYSDEHPDTLTSINNLASTYGKLGEYLTALELQEKVYTLSCSILGEDHPQTLISANNLALAYGNSGQHHRALELQKKVYDLSYKILCEDNPLFLASLHNLASTYFVLGEYVRALELQEKVYPICCRMLGEHHAKTLTALNNLAQSYGACGDYRKAVELQEKLYTLSCNVLSEKHPDTLTALDNLALICGKLGENSRALALHERAYTLRCEVLGEEHPEALTALNNLALAYGALGNYHHALELQKRVCALSRRILDGEHPHMLSFMNNLAVFYAELNEHRIALKLKENVYTLSCEVFGRKHPHTLSCLSNLAYTYNQLGEYQKSLKLDEKVYSLRCEVFGEEHPETLTALDNLILTYCALGDYYRALELDQKMYSLLCKLLGEDHPDTLRPLSHQAIIYYDLGEYQKALEISQKVYAICCKVLGTEHSDTIGVSNNIKVVKKKLGISD